jgi:uncharacterized protein involved in exopolysaccharide biosynthesis
VERHIASAPKQKIVMGRPRSADEGQRIQADARIEGLNMDFAEIFRILRRRWRVALPALLVTLMAAAGIYHIWPTTYQSTAEISLIGSPSIATQSGTANNPYLVVGSLDPMAGILASNLSSQQALQQLNKLGVTDTLTAEVPAFAAGPFVTLTLEGKNPTTLRQSMPVVIRFSMHQLKALQQNGSVQTPGKDLIGAIVIAQPSIPSSVSKRKIELVAGVTILGLVAMFLLTFSAEARANRSRKDSDSNYPDRAERYQSPRGSSQSQRGRRSLPARDRESVRMR